MFTCPNCSTKFSYRQIIESVFSFNFTTVCSNCKCEYTLTLKSQMTAYLFIIVIPFLITIASIKLFQVNKLALMLYIVLTVIMGALSPLYVKYLFSRCIK